MIGLIIWEARIRSPSAHRLAGRPHQLRSSLPEADPSGVGVRISDGGEVTKAPLKELRPDHRPAAIPHR
jgi:hypothetical protein